MAQNWTSIIECNWIFSKFYLLIYIYIYIYREREREREREVMNNFYCKDCLMYKQSIFASKAVKRNITCYNKLSFLEVSLIKD